MEYLLNYDTATFLITVIITLLLLLLIIKIIHGDFRKSNIETFKQAVDDVYKNKKVILKEDETGIFLGTNLNKKKLYLPAHAKNVYVCGTTGSGKSVALSNFINYGIDEDIPMLIIDGKGSVDENSLLDIVTKLNKNKKVYIIDLNNPAYSDKYNPFSNTGYTVVKDMLINMTEWSEEHYKVNTELYLQKLVKLLTLNNIPLSFKSITEHMSIESFEELSSNLLNSGILTKKEHINNLEYIKNVIKIIVGSSARFTTIIESELGEIFSDNGIDIYTALKENAIILFILNPLLYPELSTLIGRLITIDSKKAISRLYNDRLKRSLFIFDEVNVYASSIFLDLVNKCRSANVTSILASQSLSDLENISEQFKHQIIENCNNYIVLRQNSAKSCEEWSEIIGTKNTIDVTYQIQGDNYSTSDTGLGSARRVKEFIVHPDEIKNLKVGNGFLISKDNNFKSKIIVNKPF